MRAPLWYEVGWRGEGEGANKYETRKGRQCTHLVDVFHGPRIVASQGLSTRWQRPWQTGMARTLFETGCINY